MDDKKREKWFNEAIIRRMYNGFNEKYFDSKLPEIPSFFITDTEDSWYARTYTVLVDTHDHNKNVSSLPAYEWCDYYKVIVPCIVFKVFTWRDRFQLENALIHEMCHVWQIYEGIKQNPHELMIELMYETGHGRKFKEIADKITSQSKDCEGFVVISKSSGDEGEPSNI